MVLSDRSIRNYLDIGHIRIDPIVDENIQPASVDLTLGRQFARYKNERGRVFTDIDPFRDQSKDFDVVTVVSTFKLQPQQFALAHTFESVSLSNNVAAYVDGKSSLARLGLFVHVTAGNIDPGFGGQITLEMFNASDRPILLTPHMKICQIRFHALTLTATKGYVGKYSGSRGVRLSEYFKNERPK